MVNLERQEYIKTVKETLKFVLYRHLWSKTGRKRSKLLFLKLEKR